jgi:hypothetical protein
MSSFAAGDVMFIIAHPLSLFTLAQPITLDASKGFVDASHSHHQSKSLYSCIWVILP